MTPDQLAAAIRHAVMTAVADGALDLEPGAIPDEVTVERPRNPEHGDYATNIALQLAKKAGTSPRAVAEAVA
ncbi:MAG TPA: arginine--tRNA ligase, partial [Candidatus Nanopelagicales bacterium]|nr:arginine--tRNA ligase [Candidatus Nanopelagicales bacterium]